VETSWRGSAAACRSSGIAALLSPPFPHPSASPSWRR
jgi:hypothetical protein